MATIFLANGRVLRDICPSNQKDFSLAELQQIVGGYIQLLTLPNNQYMVLDEEGKCKNKRVNIRATQLLAEYGMGGDIIVGDALVCDCDQIK